MMEQCVNENGKEYIEMRLVSMETQDYVIEFVKLLFIAHVTGITG